MSLNYGMYIIIKNVELAISLRMIQGSNSMLYAEVSEELITESIAEFSALVGNDSPWTAVPCEQLLSYHKCFLVGYWNHSSPLAEVVLDAKNIFVPPTLAHLHEINRNLIPHFLQHWNTFQFCTSFLDANAFSPGTSVAPLNIVFNMFHDTSPVILSYSYVIQSRKLKTLHVQIYGTSNNELLLTSFVSDGFI